VAQLTRGSTVRTESNVAFALQKWQCERATVLRNKYIALKLSEMPT